jgi:hypothetical protein
MVTAVPGSRSDATIVSWARARQMDQDKIYQRVGEFVVCFQWLEDHLREIGWFILDPQHKSRPPTQLRNATTAALITEVERLFLSSLPNCRLDRELEEELCTCFVEGAKRFNRLRKVRNKILHSAYIELKAGGEVMAIMRSNPRLTFDGDTGEPLLDQEILSEKSFEDELKEMADLGGSLNRCYIQLIHRFPTE